MVNEGKVVKEGDSIKSVTDNKIYLNNRNKYYTNKKSKDTKELFY